jgi:hypothetical protein
MSFVVTPKGATGALGQFLAGQEPLWFGDRPFVGHLREENRVEPGTTPWL